ncbi:MAG: glycosyltransferase [Pseudomonadota bacterium]
MSLGIPKIICHIWIGHRPAPTAWMDSWRKMHPDWEYRLYDNEYLFSRRWRHQALINEFYRRGEYAGVSDLMRYQILYEEGGFMPEADSTCLRPTDELWTDPSLYTVYENEERKPGFVSPFLAAAPKHAYLGYINARIARRNRPDTLRKAWRSVGNKFLKKAMEARAPENVTIFPSHYFIPQHKAFDRYSGAGPVYCEQHWGSTFSGYAKPDADMNIPAVRAAHLRLLEANLDPQRKSLAA